MPASALLAPITMSGEMLDETKLTPRCQNASIFSLPGAFADEEVTAAPVTSVPLRPRGEEFCMWVLC